MGLKKRYVQNKLNRLAQNINRKVVLPNLETAKSIAVIWQPSQKDAYLYLKKYFNKEQIIFRDFCVFEENQQPQSDNNTLTSADLNWVGLPKPEKIDDFTGKQFDILFNVVIDPNIVVNYITLLSQAKFKVGTSPNEINFFDLNINIGEKDDSIYLAKQQIFYLAQLNKTTSK